MHCRPPVQISRMGRIPPRHHPPSRVVDMGLSYSYKKNCQIRAKIFYRRQSCMSFISQADKSATLDDMKPTFTAVRNPHWCRNRWKTLLFGQVY